MKSSKCLFNKAVFKSNITRFLPYSVLLLIAEIIVFPVMLFSEMSYYLSANPRIQSTIADFSMYSIASDIVLFVFAAAIGLLVYSYLFSTNKCNAMHAFPVGRKALFATGFLSSYIMLVVPQLIGFALSLPAIFTVYKNPAQIILLETASILVLSLLFLAIAALSVMLSGNLFSGALVYVIINFVVVAFDYIFTAAIRDFAIGAMNLRFDSAIPAWFSPIVSVIGNLSEMSYVGARELPKVIGLYYIGLGVYAVASAVISAISFMLYKRRQVECAGDMVASKKEIPVLSVIISIVGGALASAFLGFFLEYGNVGAVVAFIIFSFIAFFASQMILRKTARVFGAKQFILWAAAIAVSIGIVAGFASYETNYIPKASKVDSVSVNLTYDMTFTEKEDIEKVIELHKKLIEYSKDNSIEEEYTYRTYYSEDGYIEYDNYSISYQVGNKEISRRYSIRKSKEFAELLDALEKKEPPKTVFQMLDGLKFDIRDCTVEYYDYESLEENIYSSKTFSGEQAKKLYELCSEDTSRLLENYSSFLGFGNGETMYSGNYLPIEFTLVTKDEKTKEKLLEMERYINDAASSYYEFESVGDEEAIVTIEVSNLPENSKAIEYLESLIKN